MVTTQKIVPPPTYYLRLRAIGATPVLVLDLDGPMLAQQRLPVHRDLPRLVSRGEPKEPQQLLPPQRHQKASQPSKDGYHHFGAIPKLHYRLLLPQNHDRSDSIQLVGDAMSGPCLTQAEDERLQTTISHHSSARNGGSPRRTCRATRP